MPLRNILWEFPGGPVVRIPGCCCYGLGSIPGWGTETPQAVRHGPKKKENNKVLLYSTENYIQCSVINHNGKEYFEKKNVGTSLAIQWLRLPLEQARVQSLVGELRSHMPCGVAPKLIK